MAMKLWNDDRPLTRRLVLGERAVSTRGLSLRFATEQIDNTTDWCCFDDTRHLVFVHRAGRLRSMETDLDWGPSGRALPSVGDVWVVPAGDKCSSLVEGDTAGYCEIAIPDHLLGETTLVPRVKHHDPLIHQMVERIHAVADRDDALARLLTESIGETLRLLITDNYTEVTPSRTEHRTDGLDPAARSKLIAFLEDSMDSEITLEALAQQAKMSVGGFIKAFRAAFHTTPYQFLLDRRIERAKTLLQTTPRTVTEISAMVGFSTPNHFATAFRRRVGVSPSAYRDRC
ncbi:helix-turn-helix transcriptional regulator [Mycolicibacterium boenickei]|uniref:Helix-turn-helix transcriptional regulator n=1 Tax=Mycolicibacterium boenickei TaxID=146017 RepID=A0AAX2ZYX4_9MYCO|nr:helix-turn-helix transcriptional regulator [Mycolicibacterium boenickei]UNC00392.1 helix-turn-helix transcriptional regulator [Mycolicibacterium boenickei]BBX90136.1 putative transcriptional regulator, AraC family protein [Mycolicibacterium boenickei]